MLFLEVRLRGRFRLFRSRVRGRVCACVGDGVAEVIGAPIGFGVSVDIYGACAGAHHGGKTGAVRSAYDWGLFELRRFF